MSGGSRLATWLYTLVALLSLAYASYNLFSYAGADAPLSVEGYNTLRVSVLEDVSDGTLKTTEVVSVFIDGELQDARALVEGGPEEGTTPEEVHQRLADLSRLESRMRRIVRECSMLASSTEEERERARTWMGRERSEAVREVVEIMELFEEETAPGGSWEPVVKQLREWE